MRRLIMGLTLIWVTVFIATALADEPIDDPYFFGGGYLGSINDYPKYLPSTFSTPIDTVIISQLDCGLFPHICAYVDLLDSLGNPVSGMSADSFCVFQDANPLAQGSFTVQELTLDSCITSVCLVIDVSGSMRWGKMDAAKNAAHAFVDEMDTYDRVAIVTFGSCFDVVQDFTSDKDLLHTKINSISANGWTAAFDGIWKGVQLTTTELGSKAVIAITDGMENYSQLCGGTETPDGLWIGTPPYFWWQQGNPDPDGFTDDSTLICDLANGAGIPIHTISLGSSFDPQYLIHIASATGGSYYHAPTGDDIENIYDEIKYRMCSRYLVCYDSPDTIQNGDWHTMTVCRRDALGDCGPCDSDSCQESAAPVIVRTPATINLDNTCQEWGTDVEVCAWVTDLDTPQEDLDVKLFYRNSTHEGFTSVSMTRTDSLYCYSVPGSKLVVGVDSIQYYLTSSDGQVTVSSPLSAGAVNHHAFPVCGNSPPVASCPGDTSLLVCDLGEICLPGFSWSDPDDNIASINVIGGTLNGNSVCFSPITGNNNLKLIVTDEGGLADTCETNVNVTLNSPPTAHCPWGSKCDSTIFLCELEEICISGFYCDDPDDNLASCTVIGGTLNGNSVCLTPVVGINWIKLIATDECGAADTCAVDIRINLNHPPVVSCPNDTSIFVCDSSEICIPGFTYYDTDNNIDSVEITGCDIHEDTVCFIPEGPSKTITLIVTDECGAADTCETNISITFNSPPEVSCPNDTSLFVCDLSEICLPGFSVYDPDGNITSTDLSLGTLNGDSVCFTPAVGLNTITLTVTDECGEIDQCVTNVTVSLNSPPEVSCPNDTALFVCSLDEICLPGFSVSDPDDNITSIDLSIGTLNGNSVCFTPVEGLNTITLTVTDACGASDQCVTNVTISLNSPPEASCPDDTSIFVCSDDEFCLPGFSYSDFDNNISSVNVVGGTLNGNSVCFNPVSGNNTIKLIVTDECGEIDSCVTNINITINSEPVCYFPENDTFLVYDDSTFSFSISATDADNNLVGCTKTSGVGSFDGSTWTFTTSGQGIYSATFKCTDECGAFCSGTVSMMVNYNNAPVCNLPEDDTYFVCDDTTFNFIVTATDEDNNLVGCTKLSGPGTLVDTIWSFTTTGPGIYSAEFECEDSAGATCYGMVNITVDYNSAPVCNVPDDTSYLVCEDSSFSFPVSASDDDNNLVGCTKLSGPGSYNGSNWIFTSTGQGVYTAIFECEDSCGETCIDTVNITVNYNSPPSASCPNDTSIFVCDLSQICLPGFTASDPDGNITSKVVDYGYLSGDTVYFTPGDGLNTITYTVTDACGETDQCVTNVTIDLNSPPVASCTWGNAKPGAPSDTSVFVCDLSELCFSGFSCSDPDDNLISCTAIGGILNGNTICFTPVEGNNTIKLVATDACGETDTLTRTIGVTLNSPPEASCPNDTSLFVCDLSQVCLPGFTASDPDDNISSTNVSLGVLNGETVCFNPVEGVNTITFTVTDECGEVDTCVTNATVTVNNPPTASCPNDTSLFVCNLNEICLTGFIASDPDNNIASAGVDLGTLSGDTVCFTPVEGVNTITYTVTDSCGESDYCVANVNVTLNTAPKAFCPGDTSIFVCDLSEICIPGFVASEVDDNKTSTGVNRGTLSGDTVCFTPVEGANPIIFTVTDACGSADTCITNITITSNSPPEANCPWHSKSDTTIFLCELSKICITGFSCSDPDDNLVSCEAIGGILEGDSVCFTPVEGDNIIKLVATDVCGETDTCQVNIIVNLNSPPTAACPNDTTLFVCSLDEICLPGFIASDPDNNISSKDVDLGILDGQTVCFTPLEGVNTIIFTVTDECNETDQCVTHVIVNLNDPPVANCPGDTTIFKCTLSEIYLPGFSCTDPNNNLTSCQVEGGDLNGNIVTLDPVEGLNTILLIATDQCGLVDTCITEVTVNLNSPPTASCPGDTTMMVCDLSEICIPGFIATDPDNNISSRQVSNGVLDGEIVCITPAEGSNEIIFTVTDVCGETDACTTYITVILNSPPSAVCPNDTSIFVCDLGGICLPGFTATDPDNNITSMIVNPGTLSGDTVCFMPVEGLNTITFTVIDACNDTDYCVTNVTIDLNSPPTANCSWGGFKSNSKPGVSDTALFVCELDEICLPGFSCTDPDDNLASCAAIGGTYSNGEICFTPVEGLNTIMLVAIDECDETDTLIRTVDVSLNSPPTASCPNDTTIFVCDLSEICLPGFEVDDPDYNISLTNVSLGSLSGDTVCFIPVEGLNTITLTVTDDCDETDQCVTNVTINLNSPPTASCPNDTSMFVCDLSDICLPGFVGTDPDGNITSKIVDNGTLSGDTVCFTPVEGVNTITFTVTDACNESDYCITNVTILLNSAPVCSLPSDSSFLVNDDTTFNFPVSATDVDGNLVGCSKTSGVGDFDGSTWTFTATSSGVYSATFECIDSCGATCGGTVNITVEFNAAPECQFPNDSTYFICNDTTFNFIIKATDENSNLVGCTKLSGPGDLVDSIWTFTTSGSGDYVGEFECEDESGASCFGFVTITVILNSDPVCDVPNDTTYLVCDDTSFSFPITAADVDDNLVGCIKTSGAGSFDGSNWTFDVASPGIYSAVFQCEDECGAICTDNAEITIVYNSAPVCNVPDDDAYFVCDDTTFTFPVSATDVDNNLIGCTMTSATGSFDGSTWTFTTTGEGVYTARFECEDACGEICYDTLNITVDYNSQPVCYVLDDTAYFVCSDTIFNFDIYAVDDDDNLVECIKTSGPGSYDGSTWSFTAASSRVFTAVFECTDECGASCTETVNITIDRNSPPEVSCPGDNLLLKNGLSYVVCDLLQQVCIDGFTYSDIDNNIKDVVVTGGTLVGTEICFMPVVGNNTLALTVTDSCGEVAGCTTDVMIALNQPPEASCPNDTAFLVGNLDDICLPGFEASDPDNNIDTVYVDNGVISGDTVCFTPVLGDNIINLIVVDECGVADTCQIIVTIEINNCPEFVRPVPDTITMCVYENFCDTIEVIDIDGDQILMSVNYGELIPIIDEPGHWLGLYCFTVEDYDCGEHNLYEIIIEADDGVCLDDIIRVYEITVLGVVDLSIDDDVPIMPGETGLVGIYLNTYDCLCIGAINALISYDPSILTLLNVTPTVHLDYGQEYFNVTYDLAGPGTFKFVYIANLNNCTHHGPLCDIPPDEPIIWMEFQLAPGVYQTDFCIPICFEYQESINENAVVDSTGYHVWFGDGCSDAPDSSQFGTLLINFDCGSIKVESEHNLVVGDINMNGYPFESGDIVLLANYLIDPITSPFTLRQLWASDVNGDSIRASIADLIFMLNILNGSTYTPKLIPFEGTPVDIIIGNNEFGETVIKLESEYNIGGLLLDLPIPEGIDYDLKIDENLDMEVRLKEENGSIRLLIYDMGGKVIRSGTTDILSLKLPDGFELIPSVSISDARGCLASSILRRELPLPEEFKITDCYPNPFNSMTNIKFTLPLSDNITLDIYDVRGRLVKELVSDRLEAGYHKVSWNGTNNTGLSVSSGVYFVRLKSNEEALGTNIKKLVILK